MSERANLQSQTAAELERWGWDVSESMSPADRGGYSRDVAFRGDHLEGTIRIFSEDFVVVHITCELEGGLGVMTERYNLGEAVEWLKAERNLARKLAQDIANEAPEASESDSNATEEVPLGLPLDSVAETRRELLKEARNQINGDSFQTAIRLAKLAVNLGADARDIEAAIGLIPGALD